jgi:anti-sigma regulatory factor (Ser/Thr protein kinase)
MTQGGPAQGAVLSIDAWAQRALASLSGLPGVHRAGLALTEGGGRRQRFTASDRGEGQAPEWCHVDAYDDVPLNSAVRTGRPVVGALGDLGEQYAGFVARQRGTRTVALAAVPVVAAGQTLGGYVLFFDRPQPFDDQQRQELAAVSEKLGARLRRAQRSEERSTLPLADQPVPPGALVATHEVRPDLEAVGGARRFLRSTLDDWGIDHDTTDTAVLCLSELVTNAAIHTHAGCVVRVLLEDRVLSTTVRDHGLADAVSIEALDDPLRVHGRGLQVVEALASRWGSELDSAGTSVWFVLDL